MLRSQLWHRQALLLRSHVQHHKVQARRYATVAQPAGSLEIGTKLHGFTLKRSKHVPELQLTALNFQHDRTATDYLHIARDDSNNVFSIGFKTNPPDRTGVPHILEHTTLCGSEKYPVRDPFFKMLPRSLSNFMNAFTSSDHTTYPFATTNHKDFRNLMSVYLDATLRPLLKEYDFIQEGWRIGPSDSKSDSPGSLEGEDKSLTFKGVVYNEMKGQMSDSSYLYYIRFHEQMFPDLHNSGGDPKDMTNLTYNALKDFHRKNYHPSNAKIFTYGNIPFEETLAGIDQQLSSFKRGAADITVIRPLNLQDGPLYQTVLGPVDPLIDIAMQSKTSTSWIMSDCSNVLETFSLGIVSSLLLDGFGSPMYQALIEASLGSDLSANTGFDTSSGTAIFSVGLNGVKTEDVPKVKAAIQTKIREVYDKGFDGEKVKGILHQLELALKHKTAGFGMDLLQRLEPGWFNGVDPFEALAWNDIVNSFEKKFAEGGYLESLLKKYLLNDRTFTFTMEPSQSYAETVRTEESSRLSAKIHEVEQLAGGTSQAHNKLARQEDNLLDAQSQANDQDLDCLPTVDVQDIPRAVEGKVLKESSLGDVKLQWREAKTNGLTYFRAINRLDGLPTELRILIPLFTSALMRLGTKSMTVEELEDLIKLRTGGINVGYHSSPSPHNMHISTEGISLSGYALDQNIPDMFDLLRQIIQEANFDSPLAETQIRQLLQQEAGGALDSIASAGHSFASKHSQSTLSTQGLINEQIGGLTQLQHTIDLSDRSPHQGLADIIAKLKIIQKLAMLQADTLRVAITCGSEAVSANETALRRFVSQFPRSVALPNPEAMPKPSGINNKTFFPLPYQVYYSAMSLPTVPYVNPSGARLQILSHLLTHKHLHREIREKGGAYGGGASSRDLSGVFNFYSYRDPNPENTLKIMRDAGNWAVNRDWTQRDLEEAKLSTFQGIDAPQSVSDEGMVKFLTGVTQEMEQTKREQLLDVGANDIREVAQQFLVDGLENAHISVIGEKNDWATEDQGWLVRALELNKPSEFAGASDLGPEFLDQNHTAAA